VRAQGNNCKQALAGDWEKRMRGLIQQPDVVQQLLALQLPLHTCTTNLAAAIAAMKPGDKRQQSQPRGGQLRWVTPLEWHPGVFVGYAPVRASRICSL
jgi:hypothetical protein